MKLIRGLENARSSQRGMVVTLGNFDGVHLGHQKIIKNLHELAESEGADTMAVTFEPHPLKLLLPDRGVKLLSTLDQKVKLLRSYGVNHVLAVNFTREFSSLKADEFIDEVLVRRLGAKGVVVGHNFAFGKGKKGNTDLLRRRGAQYGFKVRVVRSKQLRGHVVSSSRVRSLIGWGRVAEAAELLGRPYTIKGMVIRGEGRGGTILKTPTANISTMQEIIPKQGVYAVQADFDGRLRDAVANIGTNPTFKGTHMSYEVHLLDYKGDLWGSKLKVHFLDRLREERTFPSAEELLVQIKKDIARAREIFANLP